MVDAGAAEAVDADRVELAPARPGRHHQRARQYVLAVVEVDPDQALGPVGELHRAVVAGERRVEAARLQRRFRGQLAAADPGREAEVVLDPRARPGLAARRPGLDHQRPQSLRAAVDRRRQSGRPGAEDDQVEALAVDLGAQAQLTRDLRRRGVAHHGPRVEEDRRFLARDLQPLEHLVGLGIGVDVVPVDREEVAFEQVAHFEGAARALRRDQPQHPVALFFVPGAPRLQRAEDLFAELGPAGDHLAQLLPLEDERFGLLGGDRGADRRLAGEGGDVADVGARRGGGDVDVLARLAVDELDPPAQQDEERRVADGVLVEDVALLEGAAFATLLLHHLLQPLELALGEAGVDDLIIEIWKRFETDDTDFLHRPKATLRVN